MKHLTEEVRYVIYHGLNDRLSVSEIARNIGFSASTVSREIRNHYIVKRVGNYNGTRGFNDCANRFHCKVAGICPGCYDKMCRNCGIRCNSTCKDYVKETCPFLDKTPYVCNGCRKRGLCSLEKHVYEPKAAHMEYLTTWAESHTGIAYTEEEIRRIDAFISPLVKQGLSLNHILAANADTLMASKSTLYRFLADGVLQARNIDLPRRVRYLAKKKKPSVLKVDRACRTGRTYADFRTYMELHPDTPVVQMDSVEGKKGGKVLLTIHFVKAEFMLAFLRDSNSSASVIDCFDRLYDLLGHETFSRLFRVLLGDNGSEFSNPMKIECDWKGTGELRTKVFYCDPQASWQKGSAEKNHELFRYIIPKGTDLSRFSQDDIDTAVNHVNSYIRESLGNKCPYDAFAFLYGEDVLKKLNVKKIPPNDLLLRPALLRNRG